jgi:hypothetical protein
MIKVGSIDHRQLFPTKLSLIYWNIKPNFNEELSRIARESEKYTGANPSSKKEDFTTIYQIAKSEVVTELAQMVNEGVRIYMKEQLQIEDDLYDISLNANVRIEKNQEFAFPHRHLGADLVATYYSDVEKEADEKVDGGKFIFLNPNSLMLHRPITKEHQIFKINTQKGLMVISPSYANHMTVPFSKEKSEKVVWIHNVKIIPKEKKLNANYFSIQEIKELNENKP